jgi:phosphoserine phosphatase
MAEGESGRVGKDPIVVDLDGTLVVGNTFHWTLARTLVTSPHKLPLLAASLLKGRAQFKKIAAAYGPLRADRLPYRPRLVEFLRAHRLDGRELILATGADLSVALVVADNLGLFSRVLASDGVINCTGLAKLAQIRGALGDVPFEYIGDSWTDLPIFRAARISHLVSPSKALLKAVEACGVVGEIFE